MQVYLRRNETSHIHTYTRAHSLTLDADKHTRAQKSNENEIEKNISKINVRNQTENFASIPFFRFRRYFWLSFHLIKLTFVWWYWRYEEVNLPLNIPSIFVGFFRYFLIEFQDAFSISGFTTTTTTKIHFFFLIFRYYFYITNYIPLQCIGGLHRNDKFCDNILLFFFAQTGRNSFEKINVIIFFSSYLVCVWGKVEPNVNGSRNRKFKKMKGIENISMKILKMSDRFKCTTSF